MSDFQSVVTQETLQQIMVRSAIDSQFRQQLLDDPRDAFRQYQVELPEDVNLRFIENRADATIVLPDPVDSVVEIPEAELAEINGGATPAVILSIARLSSARCAGAIISVAAAVIGDS